MTEKVLLITTSGQLGLVELDQDDFLAGLQRLVGGHIETLALAPDLTLIVNEEGLLRDLDYNLVASQFMNMHLVGNAVLCGIGLKDDEWDLTGLPPIYAELAKQILNKRNPS